MLYVPFRCTGTSSCRDGRVTRVWFALILGSFSSRYLSSSWIPLSDVSSVASVLGFSLLNAILPVQWEVAL